MKKRLSLLLAACMLFSCMAVPALAAEDLNGSVRPTAVETPEDAEPTATPEDAEPTPAPTATPEPTATPAPTATPEPTATPAPTATPTPDPVKTPEDADPVKTPEDADPVKTPEDADPVKTPEDADPVKTPEDADPKVDVIPENTSEATDVTAESATGSGFDLLPEEVQETVGANDTVDIEVSVAEVPEEDQKDVEAAEDTAEKNDLSVIFSIDITVSFLKNDEDAVPLSELGDDLAITVKVPEEYLNTDPTVTRIFYVIRVHDGVPTILDTSFHDGSVTFRSDKFSVYTLAYQDVANPAAPDTDSGSAAPAPANTGTVTQTAAQPAAAAQAPRAAVSAVPQTSDPLPFGLLVAVTCLAAAAFVAAWRRKTNK